MRWRYGDTNPVQAKPATDVNIHMGDLVYQYGGITYPLEEIKRVLQEDSTMNADYQLKRRKKFFLGVAMQESHVAQDTHIRVATTGVFEFEMPWSQNVFLGTPVGGADNQQVGRTSKKYAIGRVARIPYEDDSTVMVDIVSSVMKGGVR